MPSIRKIIKAINNVLKLWAKTLKALHPGKQRGDALKKKAIAYTRGIILGRTREVINREYQISLISRFAEENGIEIVAWFEDEVYDEDILNRPGIRKMLACKKPYDIFLVERVWALSRKMADLADFFNVLALKKAKLHAATCLWDCTSQMFRRLSAGKAIVPAKVVEPCMADEAFRKAAVRRAERSTPFLTTPVGVSAV